MIVNRRRFLQAGAAAGLGAYTPWGTKAQSQRVGYVATRDTWVYVYGDLGRGWQMTQLVRSQAPSGVAVSADNHFVYVGNAVERFEGLPSGSVEVFSVDQRNGIAPLGRFGLGLFATLPARLAISPNGRWLGVGLAAGGYNLLPLGADGLPGRVTASVRKIGLQGHDGMLVFANDGLLVSVGTDRVTALSVGADGSLEFLDGEVEWASDLAPNDVAVDAELLRAMRLDGVRGAVAVGRVGRTAACSGAV